MHGRRQNYIPPTSLGDHQQTTKEHENLPSRQSVNNVYLYFWQGRNLFLFCKLKGRVQEYWTYLGDSF